MRIISKQRLQEFAKKHPNAEVPLLNWYKIAKKTDWKNLVDVRKDFSHADLAGVCTVFNIGGNKYRLITKIYYPSKKVLIRFVLTHAEYNKKIYEDDCEC
ncbi:MAG TPA: type II toxin-antitoxin system HigB family toxin [Pyrinomonadaceae bacterium]|jgi:mRNA interferase HigB